ncbi:hypothetical protein DD238_000067 [Peronospora effusa]|uniref:Uncharacterized protein n=1 Tax=Peronospora effusa TaxID=542832 RepID=A0A3M6VV87_9STRA|nr:hypothetical protein DD238_000067 [Peronospora effusa]
MNFGLSNLLLLKLLLVLLVLLVVLLLDDDRFGHCGLSFGKSDIAGVAQELSKQRQPAHIGIEVAVSTPMGGLVSELA